jgi:hypothetical protein
MKRVIFKSLILLSFVFSSYKVGDNKSQYIIPGGAITVCTSDIDNDQDWDIITGHNVGWGHTNKSVSILENIDYGIFAVKDTSKSFCGYQRNIFAIRVNDDSLSDIVVFYADHSNGTQRYIRVYYNENGNFNDFTNYNLNNDATFGYINYGKVNNDEFDDIVVIANSDYFWGILYNNGNGGFSSPQYYNIDWPPTDIVCGDLNDDGRDDVIVAGHKLVVYYSTDTGFVYDSIGYQKGRIQLADLDKDDDLDIVCIGEFFSYTLVDLFENLGNGSYLQHNCGNYNPACWQFVVSDLNNDTLPDLITASVNNGIYLLYNEGTFQFSNPVFISVPLAGYDFVNACSADLDKNGFNDLIITQTNAHFINLLFNDGNGNFLENPITKIEIPNPKNKKPMVCYPNPFTTETTFEFTINETEQAEISVYDLQGRLIESLTDNYQKGGLNQIKWNGLDNSSKPCKPGTMVAFLKVNGKVRQSNKLIKIN